MNLDKYRPKKSKSNGILLDWNRLEKSLKSLDQSPTLPELTSIITELVFHLRERAIYK